MIPHIKITRDSIELFLLMATVILMICSIGFSPHAGESVDMHEAFTYHDNQNLITYQEFILANRIKDKRDDNKLTTNQRK